VNGHFGSGGRLPFQVQLRQWPEAVGAGGRDSAAAYLVGAQPGGEGRWRRARRWQPLLQRLACCLLRQGNIGSPRQKRAGQGVGPSGSFDADACITELNVSTSAGDDGDIGVDGWVICLTSWSPA
jgi:hypothetical protein